MYEIFELILKYYEYGQPKNGTRKHCNHRFHTDAKLRFDAG